MAQVCTGSPYSTRCLPLLFCVLLLVSACSGLGGEPRIVATVPPAPTRLADRGLPSESPDLTLGAQIYAERCTRCHGIAGQGDGQLTLSGQIPNPLPDFTDPTTTREQSIGEWFSTITIGRLDKLMPPWGDTLSESERWSVALYTYTMSYNAEQIAQGQRLWAASCTQCHGERGAGDGVRVQELSINPSDLSQPDILVDVSDGALFDTITHGVEDAMPAFGETLNDSERWALVAYVRTLSLTNAEFSDRPLPLPATTPEVEVASEISGTVSGQVTNSSVGGQIPSDLMVTLHILDMQGNDETYETALNADGAFTFSNVPIRDDRGYMVTTTYQSRTFGSDMVQGETASSSLELPFPLYELTDDRSIISIDSIVAQIARAAETLEVTQIISYQNSSDRMYSRSEQVSEGRYASVVVPLPVGAQMMNFSDDPGRYVFADNLTAVIDTRPVLPGANHVVHVSYSLPYQDGMLVDMPLEYALEGPVRLFVQAGSLGVSSTQLPALGTQNMGGAIYETYGATISLPVGDAVRFTVSNVTGTESRLTISNNLLPYVFIAIGSISILAAAALYYFGRRTHAPAVNNQRLTEMIIEQIAELDDLNARNQITPEAYAERRNRLKERLTKLMSQK